MKSTKWIALLFSCSLVSAIGGTSERDGKSSSGRTATRLTTPFDQGKLELQSASGAYLSVGHSNQPNINYTSTAYRLGIMLYTPSGDGILRGNCELMLQLGYGSIFNGPGNYVASGAAILRYNFVQPEAKWVPYVQIGAGMAYNDIYKDDREQSLVGQAWLINLEATVGVRYFFNDRWSANLEGGYRHQSNVDENRRNIGLNSLGGGVGLGYHF